MMLAPRLKAGFDRALAPDHARHRQIAGWVLTAIICAVIAWQLAGIGWADVWRERPRDWRFYALFGLTYLVQPVADLLIFRLLWGIGLARSLAAFLYKSVLNSAFVGYSGEVYLLVWARSRVALGDARLAHEIKDSNLLSAVVSTYVTTGLLLWVIWDGTWRSLPEGAFAAGVGLTVTVGIALPLALLFGRGLMRLERRVAAAILGMHAARFALSQLLTLAQWHVALPDYGMDLLVTLLALQLLVSRIPLVPNRDVLFIGVALALSGALSLAPARIAGLLLTSNALQLALHVLVAAIAGPALRSRQPNITDN